MYFSYAKDYQRNTDTVVSLAIIFIEKLCWSLEWKNDSESFLHKCSILTSKQKIELNLGIRKIFFSLNYSYFQSFFLIAMIVRICHKLIYRLIQVVYSYLVILFNTIIERFLTVFLIDKSYSKYL